MIQKKNIKFLWFCFLVLFFVIEPKIWLASNWCEAVLLSGFLFMAYEGLYGVLGSLESWGRPSRLNFICILLCPPKMLFFSNYFIFFGKDNKPFTMTSWHLNLQDLDLDLWSKDKIKKIKFILHFCKEPNLKNWK